MIDIHPQSPSTKKPNQLETLPNIHQLADMTQNEPILGMNSDEDFSPKCFAIG